MLTLTQVPNSGHTSGGCWVVPAIVQEHWDGRYPTENCIHPPCPAHSYLVPEILQLKVHSLTKIAYFQIFISWYKQVWQALSRECTMRGKQEGTRLLAWWPFHLKREESELATRGEMGKEPPGCGTQGLPAAQMYSRLVQARDKPPLDCMPLCRGRKLLTASYFSKLSLLETGLKNPILGQD